MKRMHVFAGLAALVFAAAFAAWSCVYWDHMDDFHHDPTCKEAIDALYVGCGYYFADSLGEPFSRDDAVYACRGDEAFSAEEWNCIRDCVEDNERCVGLADCIDQECEIDQLIAP